jgi:indole-3-glycerol phosphate synthase
MTILDEIFEAKRRRVDALKHTTDLDGLIESARRVRAGSSSHRFRSALEKRDRINVIAEFKKASPSKGVINGSANPAEVARSYERAGASAISVLTEEDYFRGSLDDLRAVRDAVSIPVLRKDFVFDEFQIYEAAGAGADAILLIVASLGEEQLRRLRALAEDELGMDALVEVHTEEEMRIAADIGATVIGVNNRDLRTFEVSLDVSRRLASGAPRGSHLIAESGLRSREDIDELSQLGYSGFLIGETLMRSDDMDGALRRLTAPVRVS